jgi:crotonobetainyl-CoA:carnitine CoA-transferase CaiB-like acyl-CoA transferase
LVARILRSAGARILKVEFSSRPDGARATPEFFDALHADDDVQLELGVTTDGGRAELRELIEQADVVIEASRPRALNQLGVGPDQVGRRAGRVWLSITGYGRRGPGAHWVAFGDDAAVAGGLVETDEDGDPVFCADAVADPVTGLFGAAAVLASLEAGGGHLIDLSLAGSAAALARGIKPLDGTPSRATTR